MGRKIEQNMSEYYRGKMDAFAQVNKILRNEAVMNWENDCEEIADILKYFAKDFYKQQIAAQADMEAWKRK
jgi:hypothetical protein